MHDSAFDFVRRVVQSLPPLKRVVEFGSRNINGTVREIFTDTQSPEGVYYGIDLEPGPGVDEIADASKWKPKIEGFLFDAVVCCEVFEHTIFVPEICKSAFNALRPGGFFIVTCATEPREPHSADGSGPPKNGEYYKNVYVNELDFWLKDAGFSSRLYESTPDKGWGVSFHSDIHALALKAR